MEDREEKEKQAEGRDIEREVCTGGEKEEERKGGSEKEIETGKAGQICLESSDNCVCCRLGRRMLQLRTPCLRFSEKFVCLQLHFASTDPARKENMHVLKGAWPSLWASGLMIFSPQTAYLCHTHTLDSPQTLVRNPVLRIL